MNVIVLGSEALANALKEYGVTEKEVEVYIFLVKHGAQKTGHIAKQLKKNKGLVYRILKNLQKKGLVEATLEYPTRFVAVQFEKVIDSFIKSKQKEITRIIETKKDLVSDWKKISKSELESPVEKFVVIEGRERIFQKMSQMIKETNFQLSVISTVSDLVRAEQFGVFDLVYHHRLKSKIQFHILTELSNQNLKAMQLLRATMKGFDFRSRNPDLGFAAFPRLVIRDNEEILFFITRTQQEVCLCTNCKSLIKAFMGVFNNLWINSTDIDHKIMELVTGKPISKMTFIKDSETAKRKYELLLKKAQTEIIVVTSSEGLIEFYKCLMCLKELTERDKTVRIMAPIIKNNFEVAQKLLEFCEVKHIPFNFLETTIIDGKHLFQFRNPPLEKKKSFMQPNFSKTFYTNDFKYINKTKKTFNDIWSKACVPSVNTLESTFWTINTKIEDSGLPSSALKNIRKVVIYSIEDQKNSGKLTEKEVLNRILGAKKYSETKHTKDIIINYGSNGQAIIHPPDYFNLPDIMFSAFHFDEQSSQGGGDSLIIYLWLDTPSGTGFVPVAIITNNPKAANIEKRIYRGTPVEQNYHIVKKDEFHVRIHGNTLFACWTKEISLFPLPYSLPPSCFLLEGFGKVKTGRYSLSKLGGGQNWVEFNAFEALVTFFHPSSKYSGPGTDGLLLRDWVGEIYLPP